MNENINLCEILKGHEGETFYSPCYGYITLEIIKPNCYFSLFFIGNNSEYKFTKHGKISTSNDAECVLFPSKDQRDWNKWIEEQKPKVPKTWLDYIIVNKDNFDKGIYDYCVDVSGNNNNGWTRRNTSIEKSALAFLKIYQLIETGYEGNIKFLPPCYYIEYDCANKPKFIVKEDNSYSIKQSIAFVSKQQAEEFLSYPENIQLLKDYFMIDE